MPFYSYMASMAAVLLVSVIVGVRVLLRSTPAYAAAGATAGGCVVAFIATLLFGDGWSVDQQLLVWACAGVIGAGFWFRPIREALTGRSEE